MVAPRTCSRSSGIPASLAALVRHSEAKANGVSTSTKAAFSSCMPIRVGNTKTVPEIARYGRDLSDAPTASTGPALPQTAWALRALDAQAATSPSRAQLPKEASTAQGEVGGAEWAE